MHQARNEWAEEAKYRRLVVEARIRLRGKGHYQTVDARLELDEALAEAERTPAQREALAKARKLNGQAVAAYREGKHAKALPLYRQALAIRKEALGEKHPHYAASLNDLGLLLEALGDPKTALPLSEQALAITLANLRDNASVQSDRQQLAAAEAVRVFLDLRLALPDDAEHRPAVAHVLAWKGAVLLRQQQRRLFLRLAADSESRADADALQEVTRRLLVLNQSPAALRAAQLKMLREGRRRGIGTKAETLPEGDKERLPPVFWAAFVLSGDWR